MRVSGQLGARRILLANVGPSVGASLPPNFPCAFINIAACQHGLCKGLLHGGSLNGRVIPSPNNTPRRWSSRTVRRLARMAFRAQHSPHVILSEAAGASRRNGFLPTYPKLPYSPFPREGGGSLNSTPAFSASIRRRFHSPHGLDASAQPSLNPLALPREPLNNVARVAYNSPWEL